jgi:propionate CoA-transferase
VHIPEEPIGLRCDLLSKPLKKGLLYDAQQNRSFINLEGLTLKTRGMIGDIRNQAQQLMHPHCIKLVAIVNHDNVGFELGLVDHYTEMVKCLTHHYSMSVTRYTTSTLLRVKLSDALEGRAVASHIYEGAQSSSRSVGEIEKHNIHISNGSANRQSNP